MIIITRSDITDGELDHIRERVEAAGLHTHLSRGEQRTIIGCIGDERRLAELPLRSLPGVEEVVPVLKPYKRASREFSVDRTVVRVGEHATIGGPEITVIAGPCSVENREMLHQSATAVKAAGATILRGGAFKPRSSPYSFQGMGKKGLELLALARRETGLPIVTEALDEEGAHLVAEVADCIQIGARNMQNYSLLRTIGRLGKPVLLKRGMSATIVDLLLSAEYLLAEGNSQVILCERGIRSFDPSTRNLFDLTAIPLVQKLSHLPMVADPSHGTGLREKVIPMGRAAIAAGAEGLLVEMHPNPDNAMSDGGQSLYPDQLARLVREARAIADAIGRSITESGTGLAARG